MNRAQRRQANKNGERPEQQTETTEISLADASTEQLESYAYRLLLNIERTRRTLILVEQEIGRRQQQHKQG